MAGPAQFTVTITCPGCAHAGAVQWEESRPQNHQTGIRRKLVSLSAGFHLKTAQTRSGDPLIVCDQCGATQPD